jgi:hypothetical protein
MARYEAILRSSDLLLLRSARFWHFVDSSGGSTPGSWATPVSTVLRFRLPDEKAAGPHD